MSGVEVGATVANHVSLSPMPEKVDPSYLSQILRLTLLAPEIVEAILGGRQPERMTLARLVKAFSIEWEEQRNFFGARS